ncbi:thiamine pyrophosphate-binding protein [Ruficoccus amylovorans]|uniref:Thiamine pyrophosphate-binding protein n=1 Tax=Ruficoccus amylovorans TaxID=1804625 RepID=A0A842HAL1_9BACT|nr:thiamine pyrophosphate-binding protein [Ruficoccus amylovorans]MBC2593452.1 thiamine pyrophosphate-binding protein [Ruficoccus amylovorans]
MIKVSDYIAKRLREHYNATHFFMVSGGGAMHLNDSLGRSLPYTANHHEQACAIAAEGFARVGQQLAVVNVTTGPGGLNCLNGVFGQWTDSAPVLYLSGQVKFSTCLASCEVPGLRQLGDQEVDIVTSVRHLTKYAVMVTDPLDVKYHLDRAVFEATHGRFGPVWLDVPMNVQGAMVEESELREFTPPEQPVYDLQIARVTAELQQARHPLIVAGHGIRLADQIPLFRELVERLNVPVVTTFNGFDLMESDAPHFAGRIGTVGQRCANFTLQNADCVLFLGTRNNIRQVSYNWENFASRACKIIVDIDPAELAKPLVSPDIAVHADLRDFLPALAQALPGPIGSQEWFDFSINLRRKYSFEHTAEYQQQPGAPINVYHFIHTLTAQMAEGDIMTAANGSACVCLHQAGVVKKDQRIFWNSGDASMGYDLPSAIGAQYAAPSRRVVCLAGDGSIMMNLQELQTLRHNNLPIKLFVICNDGYASIKQTQNNFFSGHRTGSCSGSGVSVPDFRELAQAFGLPSVRITEADALETSVREVLAADGPVLCEVMCETDYAFTPKLSARKLPDGSMVSPSLEDMFPFLDREEYAANLIE